MSVLGKYRRGSDKESEGVTESESTGKGQQAKTIVPTPVPVAESIPNKDRKSPIVSFSMPSDLRACLQAIRRSKAINLSMWVEQRLRDAVAEEFPAIAEKYLRTDNE
jgi:hypothetical protein